jgi:parallel beta-helix repeat protein
MGIIVKATSETSSSSDRTKPVVSAFVIPATSNSLTVPITTFTATDNKAVTGYKLTTTPTAPYSWSSGWTSAAPTSYRFYTPGTKTLYAWVKDAAGNISASKNDSVVVSLPDAVKPVVTGFTIPATATALQISILTFTATDNIAVAGYLITESATEPLLSNIGWSVNKPVSYTFSTEGAKTLYAWAKDAAGNISLSVSKSVVITLPDSIRPVITAFTIPGSALSLTVPISTFTATDNTGIAGYLLTESITTPLPDTGSWSTIKPVSYTFSTAGSKNLYAWVKDGAGNVSLPFIAQTIVTVPDIIKPKVTVFIIPATATTLGIPITTLDASDNIAIGGYILTETSVEPLPAASGWSSTKPTTYTFTTEGSKTLYAWVKDTTGNISTPLSDSVVIALPDTAKPVITGFVIPATSSSLVVPITTLTASDNFAVTGYMVTESATAPLPGAAGWGSAPTSYTFTTEGTKVLYAWAKDAAGNVSLSASDGVVISLVSYNADYYVASTGNDSNVGSFDFPWKTVAKVNATTFAAGKKVAFRCGDTWGETLIPKNSGTSGNPVLFTSYGTGNKPVLSGFLEVVNWTNEGSGIYSKAITCQSSPNVVTINGVQQGKGRYPNSGWLTIDTVPTTASVTDAAENSTVRNWTGAEMVIRKNPYVLDRCSISSHSGTTFNYTNLGTTTQPIAGWGYFLQGDLKALDTLGDWCYTGGKFYMYFGSNDPNSYVVKVSVLDKGCYVNGFDYIQVNGLSFTGFNKYGVHYANAAEYGKVDTCDISFIGDDGIYFDSRYGLIQNCTLTYINQTGITVANNNLSVLSNTITNIGLILGSALSGNLSIGIFAAGADNLYQYNTMDYIGYNGIYLVVASRSIVRNNFVNHFCLNLNDGGGIYTAGGTLSYPSGQTDRVIDGNIVLNGVGNVSGTTGTLVIVEGIYIDEPTFDIDITNNTCAYNAYSGLKLHNANNIRSSGNTFFGNKVSQLRLQNSNVSTPLRLDDFSGNKFVAQLAAEKCIKHISQADDITLLGTLDNNVYARPVDDNLTIETGTPTAGTVQRTLASWKTFSGQDANSTKSARSATQFLFDYNASQADRTVTGLSGWYNLAGTLTANYTLQPYQSIILIK